ncbi:hypothetical protein V6N13_076011 [Hibiscus sabdariffa]|uniref:Secreted protein n=1 Tax=Hibiscus sabdariffa TaxID=183260 RepID=A0ABR2UDR6_9ROSI
MVPASSGAVSMVLVFLLLSSSSRRSLSYLLWFWLLVRVLDSRSMESFSRRLTVLPPESRSVKKQECFTAVQKNEGCNAEA